MNSSRWFCILIVLCFIVLLAVSCQPAIAPEEVSPEATIEEAAVAEEPAAEFEAADINTATPLPSLLPTQREPAPTPVVERRTLQLEWPNRILLGDSDVVRLAVLPTEAGYSVTAEFPEHQTITQNVPIVRPDGFDLFAVARLDGVKFDISPQGEQAYHLPEGKPVTWHWSLTPKQPGHHRLTVTLSIRWEPLPETQGSSRQAVAYSKGLDVYAASFLGLSRGQALTAGFFSLLFGGGISLFGLMSKATPKRRNIGIQQPDSTIGLDDSADSMLNFGVDTSPQTSPTPSSREFDTSQLTAKENLLFEYFRARSGEVCEKDDLIRAVWPEDEVYSHGIRDDSLAQLIRRLRIKIEPDASNPRFIHTVTGRGYRFLE